MALLTVNVGKCRQNWVQEMRLLENVIGLLLIYARFTACSKTPPLMVYSSVNFDKFIQSYKHHCYHRIFSSAPQIPSRPFTVSPFPFPSSLATVNLISVPTLLPFPECPMYGVKQYTAFESGSFYLISLRALSSTLLH